MRGRPRKYATAEEALAAQREKQKEWRARHADEVREMQIERYHRVRWPFGYWRSFWRDVWRAWMAPEFEKRRRARRYQRQVEERAAYPEQAKIRQKISRGIQSVKDGWGTERKKTFAYQLRRIIENQKACTYCGVEFVGKEYQVDHKTPLKRGGDNSMSNLQLLCARCNTAKGQMTHEEFMFALDKKALKGARCIKHNRPKCDKEPLCKLQTGVEARGD